MNARHTSRSGLTLVEMSISFLILTVLLVSMFTLLDSANAAQAEGSAEMELETRGSRAIARAVAALRAADGASIAAVPEAPLSADEITFQSNQGYGIQQLVWSDPRSIALEAASGRLVWTENPGLASEKTSSWCRGVPALLEGEVLNAADDNGNGLIDEAGFCITREGDVIVLRLTIEDERRGGTVVSRTWTRRLYGRN